MDFKKRIDSRASFINIQLFGIPSEPYDEIDFSSQQKAAIDYNSGINHYEVDSTQIEGTEEKIVDLTDKSLYDKTNGGYTVGQDLCSKVGVGTKYNTYSDYIKAGGKAPAGYEIASIRQQAYDKKKILQNEYELGHLSQDDFLYRAYGRDILKYKYGIDFSSPSYWFKRYKSGEYGDPMKNGEFVNSLLNEAKTAYDTDTQLANMNKDSALNSIISGQEMNEATFRAAFGEEYDTIIEGVGTFEKFKQYYKAGMVDLNNRFFDSNKDGTYDYYFHDDGRVYKIGEDVEVEYDSNGAPKSARVKGGNEIVSVGSAFIKGLGKGAIDFAASIPQLALLAADGLAEAFTLGEHENMGFSKELMLAVEEAKAGSLLNDNYWEIENSTYGNAIKISETLGNLTGMIVSMYLTGGASKIASAANQTAKKALQTAAKKTIGLRAKYALTSAAKFTTGLASGMTQFNNGTILTGSKKAVNRIAKETVDSAVEGVTKQAVKELASKKLYKDAAKAWGRSATASAILSSRDFAENLATAYAINDTLGEENKRTNNEIFKAAATGFAVNFAISTVLRATFDDVGVTGRLKLLTKQYSKIGVPTTAAEKTLLSRMFGTGVSATKFQAVLDVFGDTAENMLTMTTNAYVKNKSRDADYTWASAFRELAGDASTWTAVLTGAYLQYNGTRRNYGSKHAGYEAMNAEVSNIAKAVNAELDKKIDAAVESGMDEATLRSARRVKASFNEWIMDSDALFDDPSFNPLDANGASYRARKDSLTMSERTLLAFERLQQSGVDADGKIMHTAASPILENITVKAHMNQLKYVQECANAIRERYKIEYVPFSSRREFSSKANAYLKDKNKFKRILEALPIKKYYQLFNDNEADLEQVYTYAIYNSDYDSLCRTKYDAIMQKAGESLNNRAIAREDMFTIITPFEGFDSLINDNEGSTGKKHLSKKENETIREEILKQVEDQGGDVENVKSHGVIFKLNEIRDKDYAEYEKIKAEVEVLARMAKDNPSLYNSFFAVNVKYKDDNGKDCECPAFVVMDSANTLTAEKNKIESYEINFALMALQYSDSAEQKSAALSRLLMFIDRDIKPDEKGNLVNPYSSEPKVKQALAKAVQYFYEAKMLPLQEIVAICKKANIGVDKKDQLSEIENATRISTYIDEIEAVRERFKALSAEEETPQNKEAKDKTVKEFNEKFGKLVWKIDSLPEDLRAKIFDKKYGLLNKENFEKAKTDSNFLYRPLSSFSQSDEKKEGGATFTRKEAIKFGAQYLYKDKSQNVDIKLIREKRKGKKIRAYKRKESKLNRQDFATDEEYSIAILREQNEQFLLYLKEATGKDYKNLKEYENDLINRNSNTELNKEITSLIEKINKNEKALKEAEERLYTYDRDLLEEDLTKLTSQSELKRQDYETDDKYIEAVKNEKTEQYNKLKKDCIANKIGLPKNADAQFKFDLKSTQNKEIILEGGKIVLSDEHVILSRIKNKEDYLNETIDNIKSHVEYIEQGEVQTLRERFLIETNILNKQQALQNIQNLYPALYGKFIDKYGDIVESFVYDNNEKVSDIEEYFFQFFKDEKIYNINKFADAIMQMQDIRNNSVILPKNNILVINLAEIETKASATLKAGIERGSYNGETVDETKNKLLKAIGGKTTYAIANKYLSDYIIKNQETPYIVVSMSDKDSAESVYNFLSEIGYDDARNIDKLVDIDGVYYTPNDTLGLALSSKADIERLDHLELEDVLAQSTEQDVEGKLYQYGLENAYLTSNDYIGNNPPVIADVTISDRALSFYHGEITKTFESLLKAGKVGGDASKKKFVKYLNLKSLTPNKAGITDEEMDKDLTMAMLDAIVECSYYTKAFYQDGSYENSQDLTQTFNTDQLLIMKKYGYEFYPIGEVNGEKQYRIKSFEPNFKAMFEDFIAGGRDVKIKGAKGSPGTTIHVNITMRELFPIDNSIFDVNNKIIKDGKVQEIGTNIPIAGDKQSLARNYTSFIYYNMAGESDTKDNHFFLVFQADMGNASIFKGGKPHQFKFDSIDNVGYKTVGERIDILSQDKYKDNYIAQLMLDTARAALSLNLDPNTGEYKEPKAHAVLGISPIRSIISKGIKENKTNAEIVQEVKSNANYDTYIKDKPSLTQAKSIDVDSICNKSFNATNSIGRDSSSKDYSIANIEEMGYFLSKETYEAIIDKVDEDFIESLRDYIVTDLLFKSDISVAKNKEDPAKKAKSILLKSKTKEQDGSFVYNISNTDLVGIGRDTLDQIIKLLGLKGDDATNLIKLYEAVDAMAFKEYYDSYPEEEFKDPTKIRTEFIIPRTSNITSPSVKDTKTYVGDAIYEKVATDVVFPTELSAAKKAYKRCKKGARKILSAAMSDGLDDIVAQDLINSQVNYAVITNKGSQMTANLSNTYAKGRYAYSVINLTKVLQDNFNLSEEEAVQKAKEIVGKTSGVSMSDGYQGYIYQDQSGEIKYSMRHFGRQDESMSFYRDLIKTKGDIKVLEIDPNSAIQSSTFKVYTIKNKDKAQLIDDYLYYIEVNRKFGQTLSDAVANQTPQAEVLNAIVDSACSELGIDRTIGSIFLQDALEMADGFDGSRKLSVEALVNTFVNKSTINKEERNLWIKRLNEVMNFGCTYSKLPVPLQKGISLYKDEIEQNEKVKEYTNNGYTENQANAIVKLALAALSGKKASFISNIIKRTHGKKLATATNKTKIINKYNKVISLVGKNGDGWMLDSEWASSDGGRKYLSQIALIHKVKGEIVKEDTVVFYFDLGDVRGETFNEYIGWLKKNNVSYNALLNTCRYKVDDNGLVPLDSKELTLNKKTSSIEDFFKYLNDKNIDSSKLMTYSGKGYGSDFDVLEEHIRVTYANDLVKQADMLTKINELRDNHLDLYNDFIHTVMNKRFGDTTGFEKVEDWIEGDESHDAEEDARQTFEVAEKFVTDEDGNETPDVFLIPVSQYSLYEADLLETLKENPNISESDYDLILKEAKKLIDNTLTSSKISLDDIVLDDEDKGVLDSIINYKQLDNERLRKGISSANALVNSMNIKTAYRIEREIIELNFKKQAEVIKRIRDNSPMYKKLIGFILKDELDIIEREGFSKEGYKAILKTINKMEDFYKALTEYYYDKIETTSKASFKSLSQYKVNKALALVLENVEEFYKDYLNNPNITNYFHLDDINQFTEFVYEQPKIDTYVNTMSKLRKASQESYVSTGTNDAEFQNIKNQIYKSLSPEAEYALEMSVINSRINGALCVFDSYKEDGTSAEINEMIRCDMFDLVEAPTPEAISLAQKAKNIFSVQPKALEILTEIINQNPEIGRTFEKLTSLKQGTDLKDCVTGITIKADSSVIDMPRNVFEKLYGMTYEEARTKFGLKNNELMYVSALRHPSDKGGTIKTYKLCVSNRKDRSIRMTNTAVFSNHNGDFDGDNLVVFKVDNKEQERLLNIIGRYQNRGLCVLDKILSSDIAKYKKIKKKYGLVKKSVHVKKDDTLSLIKKYQNKSIVRNNYQGSLMEYIDNKSINFLYKASKIKDADHKAYKDDVILELINELNVNEKDAETIFNLYCVRKEYFDVDDNVYAYTTSNEGIRNCTGYGGEVQKAVRELIDKNENEAIYQKFRLKGKEDKIAAVTGIVQEIQMKTFGEDVGLDGNAFEYRPIRIADDVREELQERYEYYCKGDVDKTKEMLSPFKNILNDKALFDNCAVVASDNFDAFIYIVSKLDFMLQKKSGEALAKAFEDEKQNLKPEDRTLSNAFKTIKDKTDLRIKALELYESLKEEYPVARIRGSENLLLSSIANAKFNSDRQSALKSSSQANFEVGKFKNKWIVIPKQGYETEVFIPYHQINEKAKEYNTIKLRSLRDINDDYDEKDIIPAETKIDGVELEAEYKVLIKRSNGDMVLAKQKPLGADLKIADSSGIFKLTSTTRYAEIEEEEIDKINQSVSATGIDKDDVIGISLSSASVKKALKSLPADSIKEDNSFYYVKSDFYVIEDVSGNKVVDEKPIDYYTLGMNTRDVNSFVNFGGAYIKIDENGDINLTDENVVRLNRFEDEYNQKNLGFKDGSGMYKRILLYTSMQIALRNNLIDYDEANNIVKYIKSNNIDTDQGTAFVYAFIRKNLKSFDNIEKLCGENKYELNVFNKDLFSKVFGFTATGIDNDKTSEPIYSKNQGPEIAISRAGKYSLSKEYDTQREMLEDIKTFKKSSFVSKLDVINALSVSNGRGVITTDDVMSVIDKLDVQVNRKKTPMTYVAYDKFGVDANSYTKKMESSDTELYDSDYEDIYVPNNSPKYQWFDKNSKEKIKTKFLKCLNTMQFALGDYDSMYDRAYYLDPRIKSEYKVSLPGNRIGFDESEGLYVKRDEYTPNIDKKIKAGEAKGTYSEVSKKIRKLYRNSVYMSEKTKNKYNIKGDYNAKDKLKKFGDLIKDLPIRSDQENKGPVLEESFINRHYGEEEINIGSKIETNAQYTRKPWATQEYDNEVKSNLSRNILAANGVVAKTGYSAETERAVRNASSKDYSKVSMLDYKAEEDSYNMDVNKELNKLYGLLGNETEAKMFNDFMALRGLYERLKTAEAGDRVELLSQIKKRFNLEEEEIEPAIIKYQSKRPVIINYADKIVDNLNLAARTVSKELNTGTVNLYNIYSVFGNKSTFFKKKGVVSTLELVLTDKEYKGRELNNFFDSVSIITTHIAKAQSVLRMADRLKKAGNFNNTIIKLKANAIIENAILNGNELNMYSKKENRHSFLNIIRQQNDLPMEEELGYNAQSDYSLVYNALVEKRKTFINAGIITEEMSYNDIVKALSDADPALKANIEEALTLEVSMQQIKDSVLSCCKSAQDEIIKMLNTYDNNETRVCDSIGRKIATKWTNDSSIYRKPISELDVSSIFEGVKDQADDPAMYNKVLALRALSGDVYISDKLLINTLDKNVFTTKIPNKILQLIKKSSAWCSKMLMSQPLKIVRRLLQFSAYDLAMSSMFAPKTFMYLPKSSKELRAFFQSKGAVCSDDLREYLKDQGFSYGEIKGYDPITMENNQSKSKLDKAYFDKVSKVFSYQNLYVRYAFYTALKNSFEKGEGRYGFALHKKDSIDQLSSNGEKAMYVLDTSLGGPGGFSELSKNLSQYGFVFTTFPLAVARLGVEGASTCRYLLEEARVSSATKNKDLMRSLVTPIVSVGATAAILTVITKLICEMFDCDDDTEKEIIEEFKFIDPLASIMSDTVVPVNDNSIWQPQAIFDMFDSFKDETATTSEKIYGFANENFISKINPMIKAGIESILKYDTYGTQVNKNDNSIIENATKKMLAFVVGYNGANSIINDLDGNISSKDKIKLRTVLANALSAELGNSKDFKEKKKNYYKEMYKITALTANADKDENSLAYTSGIDYNESNAIGKELMNIAEDGGDITDIYKVINDKLGSGVSYAEIKQALRNISITYKLDKLKKSGKYQSYIESLSESDLAALTKAISFERSYLPFIDTITEEVNDRLYDNDYKSTYSGIRTQYNPYVNTSYVKPVYSSSYKSNPYFKYRKGKDYESEPKRMFVRVVTPYTGSYANDIYDRIGLPFYEKKNYNKSGYMKSEYYTDRRNKKPTVSDWRND